MGTVVAYEVARRLVEAGETIGFLGLLDPPPAENVARRVLVREVYRLATDGEGAAKEGGPLRRLRYAIGRIVAKMSGDERRDLVKALSAFTEAGGEPSVTAGDLGWI